MNLSNVMNRNLEMVSAETSLQDAANRMAERDIGMLVVTRNKELVGTVTDRDITIRGVARGLSPSEGRVQDAMTTNVVTCEADAPLETGAKAMQTNKVRRLIVTEDGRAVGVVSLGDLSRESESQDLAKDTLSATST